MSSIFLGIILPKDPLDYESIWACDQCPLTLTPSQVEVLEEKIEDLIKKDPDPGTNRVDFYEGLLNNCERFLHETHYLLMKVKSNLISQYGNVPGYFYPQMSYELVSCFIKNDGNLELLCKCYAVQNPIA